MYRSKQDWMERKRLAPSELPSINGHRTLTIKESSGYEKLERKQFPLKRVQRPRQAELAWKQLLKDIGG